MKLKNKKIIAIIIFLGLGFAFLGSLSGLAEAAGGATGSRSESKPSDQYTPLAPLPGTTNSEGQVTIDSYLPGIFNLTIGIAGVLAVLMILIGGVEYITTDAIQGKSDGKSRISNALWGLVLVLVSWILLHTINPKLTVFDLTIKESVSSQSTDSDDGSVDDSSSDSSINDSSSNSSNSSEQIQDSVSI